MRLHAASWRLNACGYASECTRWLNFRKAGEARINMHFIDYLYMKYLQYSNLVNFVLQATNAQGLGTRLWSDTISIRMCGHHAHNLLTQFFFLRSDREATSPVPRPCVFVAPNLVSYWSESNSVTMHARTKAKISSDVLDPKTAPKAMSEHKNFLGKHTLDLIQWYVLTHVSTQLQVLVMQFCYRRPVSSLWSSV